MRKRDEWAFTYVARNVSVAAEEKRTHHEGRYQHWQEQAEKAQVELREKGIELREHDVTGGMRLDAVLDPERARWLSECQTKAETHRKRADEYGGYAEALALHPEDRLELTVDDVLFFGLTEARVTA